MQQQRCEVHTRAAVTDMIPQCAGAGGQGWRSKSRLALRTSRTVVSHLASEHNLVEALDGAEALLDALVSIGVLGFLSLNLCEQGGKNDKMKLADARLRRQQASPRAMMSV